MAKMRLSHENSKKHINTYTNIVSLHALPLLLHRQLDQASFCTLH